MNAKRVWLVLVLFLFCLPLSVLVGCGGGDDDDDDDDEEAPNPWNLEIVDQEGDVGSINSMAVEENGSVHISYFDADNQRVKHASGSSGDWTLETLQLEDEFLALGPNAIGVDASGAITIVYTSESTLDDSGTLWYNNNSGSAWSRISIAAEKSEDLNMHVQDDGVAHIVFTTTGGSELWYLSDVTGNWAQAMIDSGGISEIAVTANELSRGLAAYYHSGSGSLRYSEYTASGWAAPVTVAEGEDVGRYPDILYLDGVTYICFYDGSAGTLKLATLSDGEWSVSTLDESGDVGEQTSATIGPLNSVHISYYGAPALRYATNWGDVWNSTQVDAKVGNGACDTSIGVDGEGYISIAYYDITDQLLKFAGSKEPVDNLAMD